MKEVVYDLEITVCDSNRIQQIKSYPIRGAKNLIELMSKFNLLILQIQNEQHEEALAETKSKMIDDDIPF